MGNGLPTIVFAAALMVSTSVVLAKPLDPGRALPSVSEIKSPGSKPLFKQLKVGMLDLALETNTRGDVERAIGGKIRGQGDAGGSTYWLCFAGADANGPPSTFWFPPGEMGGSDHGILSIPLEPNLGGTMPEGCTNAPSGLTSIDINSRLIFAFLRIAGQREMQDHTALTGGVSP